MKFSSLQTVNIACDTTWRRGDEEQGNSETRLGSASLRSAALSINRDKKRSQPQLCLKELIVAATSEFFQNLLARSTAMAEDIVIQLVRWFETCYIVTMLQFADSYTFEQCEFSSLLQVLWCFTSSC